jgi:hypothetical protein
VSIKKEKKEKRTPKKHAVQTTLSSGLTYMKINNNVLFTYYNDK